MSLLEQRTLAKFMEQWHWERHMRRMRSLYQKKHDALLRAVTQQFGRRAAIIGQGAGLHVVLQLANDAPGETALIERARAQGIRLFPFSAFYLSGQPVATRLLLGFGGMTVSEIEQGVTLLAKLC